MPHSEARVVEATWGVGVLRGLRVVDELGWAGEGTVDEAHQQMAAEDGRHLRPPVEVVLVAKPSGDQGREVERRLSRGRGRRAAKFREAFGSFVMVLLEEPLDDRL
jgi:hypothetical protein